MLSVTTTRPDVIGRLPQLQNMVKRDPEAYHAEFLMQYRHYESQYQLFLLQPSNDNEQFGSLISFLSHVASCYPIEMKTFPEQLIDLLKQNYLVLQPELRKTLVQAVILLRNRHLIEPIPLLKLFFELFRCPDKKLRELLFHHIVADIRQLNTSSKNHKVNHALQGFLFDMLQDDNEHAALKSLQVLIELFRKKIWHDARSVNVIATACRSKNTKLLVMSISFFLGIDSDILEEEEKVTKEKQAAKDVDYHLHSKKTKKRHRETLSTLKQNKRARQRDVNSTAVFPAIELLHDPQGVCEKQFKILRTCTERFEVKLLMMNFISRVLGFHKLVLLQFYPLLQRYLHSHQQQVTVILAYLVQSCHELIPPEELLPVVKSIANNFISERCTSEVLAVGINTTREIFRRVPLLLECEGMDALVADFIQFNRSRDKTTVMAARGVLNLIRELHPMLLTKKQRGKFHNVSARPKQFGELNAAEGVDGAELLAEAEAAGRFDGEDNGDGWDMASVDDDANDGEWVDISDNDSNQGEQVLVEDDSDGGEQEDMEEGHEKEDTESIEAVKQSERIDAKRILTPLDFERIALLKRERDAALLDPKSRSKRKAKEDMGMNDSDATKVAPQDLEGYSKKKRMTQEERLRTVLEGRTEFKHKQSGGGTTNKEKKRLKHFMMIKKSKHVQSKVLASARKVQSTKNKVVKKLQKKDQKKRRKL